MRGRRERGTMYRYEVLIETPKGPYTFRVTEVAAPNIQTAYELAEAECNKVASEFVRGVNPLNEVA